MTGHTSDTAEGKLERIADSYRLSQERTVAITDDNYRRIGQDYLEETD